MDDPRELPRKMLFDRLRDVAHERTDKLNQCIRDHAGRGVLNSGMRHEAVYAINRQYLLENPLKLKVEIEKELIGKKIQLPDHQLVETLKSEIRAVIEKSRGDLMMATDEDLRAQPDNSLRGHFHQKIGHDCEKARADYFNKVDILMPLATAELRQREEPIPMNITYNITGMANFGQVIGDIRVNVKQLQQDGLESLAKALSDLAEAVVNAKDLDDERKAEAIGQIRVLTDQAKVKDDSRTKVVTKTILASFPTVIAMSHHCSALWDKYKEVILQFFQAD